MSKRVAVYARVSTTRQAENDISIPDQLAQARRYCDTRGWHVMREFVDAGASARDEKRPEFQRMMDAACVDPSPFDVVLVHSQSRFFRDTAGYVVSKRKLGKHGVAVVSMTQDFGEGPSAEFAETIIAASDALHSAETAKHVMRTMLENARQGFWNGSKPPFGYRTVAVEQRGQRLKKRLEIDPVEAETVRLIFRLFALGNGTSGSMGIKAIASWLNTNGFTVRGIPFYMSRVHRILTCESYAGTHYYNQHDSRSGKPRPKSEWIAVAVPAIIPHKEFETAQARLHERRPTATPPRITTSDVLLTGLARCESCGAPLMLRTGKGGRYRYYACASHRLKGIAACGTPIAVPEAELDRLVLGALVDHLLTPERLPQLLREAYTRRRAASEGNQQRRSSLTKQRKESESKIGRLYEAVETGMLTDTSLLRSRLQELEKQRDETLRLLAMLDTDLPPLRQVLSNAQATQIASQLKARLLDASKPLQRRYVRGLVSEIVVDREKAVICGPQDALATATSAGTFPEKVRTFARDWRSHGESNPGFSLERAAS
jgi:site-specific DNA recombinase